MSEVDAARYPRVAEAARAARLVAFEPHAAPLLTEAAIPFLRLDWLMDLKEDRWKVALRGGDGEALLEISNFSRLLSELDPSQAWGPVHGDAAAPSGDKVVLLVVVDTELRRASGGVLDLEGVTLAVTLLRVLGREAISHETADLTLPGASPGAGDPHFGPRTRQQRLDAWEAWLEEIAGHAVETDASARALAGALASAPAGASDISVPGGAVASRIDVREDRAAFCHRFTVEDPGPWRPTSCWGRSAEAEALRAAIERDREQHHAGRVRERRVDAWWQLVQVVLALVAAILIAGQAMRGCG